VFWDLIPIGAEQEVGQYIDRQTYIDAGVYTIALTIPGGRVEGRVTVLRQ